jgi:hypothetical protein
MSRNLIPSQVGYEGTIPCSAEVGVDVENQYIQSIQFDPGWLCVDFELVSPLTGNYYFVARYSILRHIHKLDIAMLRRPCT